MMEHSHDTLCQLGAEFVYQCIHFSFCWSQYVMSMKCVGREYRHEISSFANIKISLSRVSLKLFSCR